MTGPRPPFPAPPPGRGPVDTIPLRNLTAEIIAGNDAETLASALNAFFQAAGEATLVQLAYVAEWEVLVVYAR